MTLYMLPRLFITENNNTTPYDFQSPSLSWSCNYGLSDETGNLLYHSDREKNKQCGKYKTVLSSRLYSMTLVY